MALAAVEQEASSPGAGGSTVQQSFLPERTLEQYVLPREDDIQKNYSATSVVLAKEFTQRASALVPQLSPAEQRRLDSQNKIDELK